MRVGVNFTRSDEPQQENKQSIAPVQNHAFAWFARNPWFQLHRYRGNDPEWLEQWERTIPRYCKCEEGYREIKERIPPAFESPESFFNWTVAVHNEVNKKLDNDLKRYPQIEIDEALRLWRSELALWQPIQFGGLERWSISMSSRMRSFGTIVDGNVGDEQLANTLLNLSPKVRLLDAAKHGVPIVLSCVRRAAPILNSDLILLAHGYCDWTRDWVMSSHGVCRRLVGVSKVVAKHVTEWTGRHCDVIENGIETERLVPNIDRNEMRASLSIPEDAFVVGYSGRIAAEKRCDLLVRAVATIDDSYLLLCGWHTKHVEQVRYIAAELNIEHRVKIMEPINQVGNFLNAIDVFATVPSTEGFGLSVVEAMQFGLPVVSSRLGILVDLTEQYGEFGPMVLDSNADVEIIANALLDAKPATINFDAYTADSMVQRWREYLAENDLGRTH